MKKPASITDTIKEEPLRRILSSQRLVGPRSKTATTLKRAETPPTGPMKNAKGVPRVSSPVSRGRKTIPMGVKCPMHYSHYLRRLSEAHRAYWFGVVEKLFANAIVTTTRLDPKRWPAKRIVSEKFLEKKPRLKTRVMPELERECHGLVDNWVDLSCADGMNETGRETLRKCAADLSRVLKEFGGRE